MIIVAGPCQLESSEQAIDIASELHTVCQEYDFDYYFKSSFDKANRTSIHGKRGPGMSKGLEWLNDVKTEVGCKVLTDVHETWQLKEVAPIVDVLQIPAFLCRQTDLIQAACETDCIVNIKKGQFMSPMDIEGILSKTTKAKQVWITERGTSFGYGRLINDFTGMYDILSDLHDNFVYDVTHSVQQPGGTTTGGNRDYVPGLARAGAALGISSFFLEVHPEPDYAPSDGANMLDINDFEWVVKDITNISKYVIG